MNLDSIVVFVHLPLQGVAVSLSLSLPSLFGLFSSSTLPMVLTGGQTSAMLSRVKKLPVRMSL